MNKVILGIDIGTSGVRGCIVEKQSDRVTQSTDNKILCSHSVKLVLPQQNPATGASTQDPALWIEAIDRLLLTFAKDFDLRTITQLILDATSSTVLLCNTQGRPLTDALMYNDQQASAQAQLIQAHREFNSISSVSGASGTSSTLAKALLLLQHPAVLSQKQAPIICHQIDYVNAYLCQTLNITDENNALKLGYDSIKQTWPNWVKTILADASPSEPPIALPKVVKPGSRIAAIAPQIAKRFGFAKQLSVHAGTTDSIAGFLASGASQKGDAVSSLGSTLAVKLISDNPIFNAQYGIYSHRLGANWLVGGASNTGGAIILDHYTLSEITLMLTAIEQQPELVNYAQTVTNQFYPLRRTGERFPIADSNLPPKKPPKPNVPLFNPIDNQLSPAHLKYLICLLQGLTDIEQLAYQRLIQMGAPRLNHLYSVGGGVKNRFWMQLREQNLSGQAKLQAAFSLDAAYGVTQLIK